MTKHACSFFLLALLTLALILCGCDKKAPEPTAAVLAPKELLKVPFRDPVIPQLFELPSGALSVWRKFGKYQPALMILTSHLLLDPIADSHRAGIDELLRSGTDAEIIRRGQLTVADPAFYSSEVVSIGIEKQLFSEIILVIPTTVDKDKVSLTDFQAQLINSNFLTKKESQSLTLQDGVISGTIRGIPLRIAHPDALPQIDKPIILHVDLGYFKNMYIDEVKTPLYALLFQMASKIRDKGYQALAVTMSFSHREIFDYSLETRFMLRDLAELLRNPQTLAGSIPRSWTLRSAALYARIMFLENKAKELTAQAAMADPSDPAAVYMQALELLQQKRLQEGFTALDRAVALDPGYGLAYEQLATHGLEIGQQGRSIELLNKAVKIFPENPFLRLDLADLLIQGGQGAKALPLLENLSRLPWSKTFYSNIPAQLEAMIKVAKEQPIAPPQQPATPNPKNAPKRQKFNHMGMGIPGQ